MSMMKKIEGHSELLEDALADLILYGVLVVPDQHLIRWTDTTRVTHTMWKYIHDLYKEVLEAKGEHRHGYKLYVGEGSHSYTFMIWDRGEGIGASDPWWVPIETLELPKRKRASVVKDTEAVETAEAA